MLGYTGFAMSFRDSVSPLFRNSMIPWLKIKMSVVLLQWNLYYTWTLR